MGEARGIKILDRLLDTQADPHQRDTSRSPRVGARSSAAISTQGQPATLPAESGEGVCRLTELFNDFNIGSVEPTTMPKHISDHITSEMRRLRSALVTLPKARRQFENLSAQYSVFVESESDYPEFVKPFKSNLAATHLDDPWSMSQELPFDFRVSIPAGTSRREAGSLVHRSFAKLWKGIELEAQHSCLAEARLEADSIKLADVVRSALAVAQVKDRAAEFGLENPESVSESSIITSVKTEYARMYRKFEAELQRRATQSDSAKKDNSQLDADISELSPKKLFLDAVNAAVNERMQQVTEKLGNVGIVIDVDMMDKTATGASSSADAASSKFVGSLSKNRISPPVEVGHNSRKRESDASKQWYRKPPRQSQPFCGSHAKSSTTEEMVVPEWVAKLPTKKRRLYKLRYANRAKRAACRPTFSPLIRRFMYLMRGCPATVWPALINLESQVSQKLFNYSVETRSLSPVIGLPWPVQWLLTHHSPKFRYCSAKRPNLGWLLHDSRQAIHSFLWRSHLSGGGPLPLVSRPRSRNLPLCMPMVGTIEHRWSTHFLRVLQSVARGCQHSSAHVNTYGLFRLALRQLKCVGVVALPLDKSPGYAIITPQQFPAVEALAVSAEHYCASYPPDLERLATEYRSLARSVGGLYDEDSGKTLASNIAASFNVSYVVSPLKILVKSHKPSGEVGVRTIHAGFQHSFRGLSMWVHKTLQPSVDNLSWVARDSNQVHEGLRSIVIEDDATITIEDLKDFYLTGDVHDVATTVGKLVEPAKRSVMTAALLFLLSNQFVKTTCASHLHKVVSGSGIGLLHSANVATLFYFAKIEKFVSPCANTVCCFRYHDDIICVHASREAMRQYHGSKRVLHAKLFTSKIEVYSVGKSCVFLDLSIGITTPFLTIAASQVKPVTPLCPTSCHNMGVHRSWPSAVANRVFKLSGESGEQTLKVLSKLYEHANSHPYTLAVLRSCSLSLCSSDRFRGNGKRLDTDNYSRVPCVMRYHPIFKLAFRRALRSVPAPPELGIRLVPAWRNALPSLCGFINHTNRHNLSCMVSG